MAWTIITSSIAHALDFDAKHIPSAALDPIAVPLAAKVTKAAMEMLVGPQVACGSSEVAHERAALAGAYGGVGLRPTACGSMADATLLATRIANRAEVVATAKRLGRPVSGNSGEPEAEAARAGLLAQGVEILGCGAARLTAAAREEYERGPWAADATSEQLLEVSAEDASTEYFEPPGGEILAARPRRVAARAYRLLEALNATRLVRTLNQHGAATMLAAGGPGTGRTWSAPSQSFWDDAHWRMAGAMRLGLLSRPSPTSTCRLKKAGSRLECGTHFDRHLVHALVCKFGPARMRPHRAVQNVCAAQLRDAGASVDLERVVPALHRWGPARSATSASARRGRAATAEGSAAAARAGPDAGTADLAEAEEECEEAVLDVVACWPGQCEQHCIDVTIRCPYGVRYERAGVAPGVASSTAEKEKKARYGPSVLPLAYETLGRLGLESQRALQQLAQQARCFASDAVGRGKRLVSAWRREQERALLWAEADVVLVSLGAQDHLRVWSRGRRPPQPPADEGAERCGPGQQRTASSRCLPLSDAL